MDTKSQPTGHSGTAGGIVGLLIFLAGVALLVWTFKLAADMFMVDPTTLFKTPEKTPLDVGRLQDILVGVIFRIILLLVMAIVGGMVANRGIRLYSDSRGSHPLPKSKEPA